jgi:translin
MFLFTDKMILDKKEFSEMRKELELFDRNREKAIEISRDIIKQSKLIIYAVQRGNLDEAEKKIVKLKELIKRLPSEDFDPGMATVARQEYVEAVAFYHYIKNDKLVSKKELGVKSYDYLLGICDLSGELMRKAVNFVIKDKIDEAERIRDIVDQIYHEFLEFNLRNGDLRKKSDQIKWNLEKLENMMYDLKIKRG